MIQIQRNDCPEILQRNTLRASYYNNEQVTDVLFRMQFGKCAYCEKSIKEGAQVDHYVPIDEYVTGKNSKGKKQYNWNQANRWENLLYSCVKCNGAKTNENPFCNGTRVIIDPSDLTDDPEKHIDFIIINKDSIDMMVSVIPKDSSVLGKHTINYLKLKMQTRKRSSKMKENSL